MRVFLALSFALFAVSPTFAADKPDLANRHGLPADVKAFPQAAPKEALASVLKAIEDKKIDYLTAHLIDPEFVDLRLKETATTFAEFVKEVTAKLASDTAVTKQFPRFLKEGVWETKDERTMVTLKDVPDRCLYLRKIEGRWFLENRYQPEEKK